MGSDRLVVINQISPEFGEFIGSLEGAPQVINHHDPDRPWELEDEADILVTRGRGWKGVPDEPKELKRLKWVQTYSAGVEMYPDWLKRGRIVTTGRGLTSPQIAEYALAAMLRVEKNFDTLRATSPETWGDRSIGTLEGKVLGVVGYGAIGQEVVQRARAFGMTILASRRGAWETDEPGVTACASAQEVVAAADHLVLALPLTAETRHMFDAGMFASARPGQHLINVARGGLIDQPALIAALDAGQLSYATLDVTDPEPLPEGHPLWTHPKVLVTPHISYLGGAEFGRFKEKFAANFAAYVSGRALSDVLSLERGY